MFSNCRVDLSLQKCLMNFPVQMATCIHLLFVMCNLLRPLSYLLYTQQQVLLECPFWSVGEDRATPPSPGQRAPKGGRGPSWGLQLF